MLFADPEPQPLLGLYHTALLPGVRARLEMNRLAVRRLIHALGPAAVHLPEPVDWPARLQANRREELIAYQRKRDCERSG